MRTKTLVAVSLILFLLFLSVVFSVGFIFNPQNAVQSAIPLQITPPKSVEENVSNLVLTVVDKTSTSTSSGGNSGNANPVSMPAPPSPPINSGVTTRAS